MLKRIAILGKDGAGKTTLMKRLDHAMQKKRLRVGKISLPRYETSGRLGRFLGGKLSDVTDAAHTKKMPPLVAGTYLGAAALNPWLRLPAEKGKDVLLMERHAFDAMAYGPVYESKKAYPVARFLSGSPVPNVVIYIKCPTQVALERIKKRNRGVKQIHETAELLDRLDAGYDNVLEYLRRKYGKKTKVIVVDGSGTKAQVERQAEAELRKAGII